MIQEFEFTLDKRQLEDFFSATAWSQDSRPTAPPTIATVFRQGEFKALAEMKIPLNEVLHGDQRYEFAEDLRAGEKYKCRTELASKHEKSGAMKMVFYLFITKIVDTSGKMAVSCATTLIHRTKGDAK